MITVGIAIGLLIMSAMQIFDRKMLRVEWPAVASFLAFMALLTVYRIGRADLAADGDLSKLPTLAPELLNTPLWRFLIVFWEDAVFAVPMYYAHRFLPKRDAWVFTVIMASLFGLAHMYQGWPAVVVLGFLSFVSVHYARKHGFGTTMICHILYDFITFYTAYFIVTLTLN